MICDADNFRIYNTTVSQGQPVTVGPDSFGIDNTQGSLTFAKPEQRQFKTIREVAAAVAQDEGITLQEILTPHAGRANPTIGWARTRAYLICDRHKLPNGRQRWSKLQVARAFGMRNASAIIHAINRYKGALGQ